MSIDGKSPIYIFLDSTYRNRKQWPCPTEFEAKFLGGSNDISSSDLDIILSGATAGDGNIYNFDHSNPWLYPPIYPNGFKYHRGIIEGSWGPVDGVTLAVFLLQIGNGVDQEVNLEGNGLYNGLFIELYDNINPTKKIIRQILNFDSGTIGGPIWSNSLPVVFDRPIEFDVVAEGYTLYSMRYYGPAVMHGTITAATENTVTLFAGTFVSNIDDTYVGKYLLIVDTDTSSGSGRYENINRIYKISAYDRQTLLVTLQTKFSAIPTSGTRYEILDMVRPTEGALSYRGSIGATMNQYRNYEVGLVQLSVPGGALKLYSGNTHSDLIFNRSDLREIPYLAVELINIGGGQGPNSISTNNIYMNTANFVIFIREDENPGATRSLMYSGETHAMSFKLTDTLKVSIKRPTGELLTYFYIDAWVDAIQRWHDGSILYDRTAPFPPEPNLQIGVMFSFTPK